MSNENSSETAYIPGVCNIGKEEITARKRIAIGGFIFTLLLVIAISVMQVPQYFRILVFIPLFGAIVSGLQVVYKFCVAFGVLGKFSFSGKIHSITPDQAEYLKADRLKAIKIIVTSLVIAGAITATYYFLPG